MPAQVCGVSHAAALGRGIDNININMYWMFSAAYDGCLSCVKHAIQEGCSADATSRSGQYNAMSWAQWGEDQEGKDTVAVQSYLRELGVGLPGPRLLPTDASIENARDAAQDRLGLSQQGTACHAAQNRLGLSQQSTVCQNAGSDQQCQLQHVAACKRRPGDPKYAYFSAAFDGCLQCVRRWTESGHVDVNVMSDHGGYNAMSWAHYGKEGGHNTDAVQAFLADKRVTLPPSRRDSGRGREAVDMPTLSETDLATTYGTGKKIWDAVVSRRQKQSQEAAASTPSMPPAREADEQTPRIYFVRASEPATETAAGAHAVLPRMALTVPVSHRGAGFRPPGDRRGIGAAK